LPGDPEAHGEQEPSEGANDSCFVTGSKIFSRASVRFQPSYGASPVAARLAASITDRIAPVGPSRLTRLYGRSTETFMSSSGRC
jgi:hypothetical protein